MRTFFVVVSRGLVSRNLLRTGIPQKVLEQADTKLVLLFPKRSIPIPDYLYTEFADPRIVLEEIEEYSYSPFVSKIWMPLVNNFVYSESTDILARDGSAKVRPVPSWWYPFHKRFFSVISKPDWLKKITRWLEEKVFSEKRYDALFKKYKPEALLVGSLLSKADIGILKAAKRHGAISFGMQKGWDNLERVLIRTLPDHLLVQNSIMVDAAREVQRIPKERAHVVGFPQFDPYFNYEPSESRESFLHRHGLKPDTKLFFFGSEGAWSPNDPELVKYFIELRKELPFPSAFIIRPHFTDIKNKRFDAFRRHAGLIVDDNYRWAHYFSDLWDPSQEDMTHFMDELYFCDAVLCIASTLSLDAACFDKPIINLGFGAYIDDQGRDLSSNLYRMAHYKPVVASGGVSLVSSKEELKKELIRSIEHPELKSDEREILRRTMCGPLDGRSSERIANHLLRTR